LYGAAYRIVQFGLLPVGTLVGVSHQRFLKHTDGDKKQHMRRSLQFAGVTAIYGVVFALGVYICAPLLGFLLDDEFKDAIPMVRWLTPLVVLRGLAIFPLNGLMGLGKTALRTGLLLGSAAFSMVLYVALIPSMTWKGAAIGTVVGEAALAVAAWALLIKYQRVDDEKSREAELAVLIRKAQGLGDERRPAS
jgi:O-antigen/teichoic acid export membrane protein